MDLLIEDFKNFFKRKQEQTASSPSGRHMGHYKTLLEEIRRDNPEIPEITISIAYISLITASSLKWWHQASQVMIEKGKGKFIEHLWIIQLVEADLNFVLHTIWGNHLIRHAKHLSILDNSQYAIPWYSIRLRCFCSF